ncbi:MAG TPA: outer membrane beta-barrel protein [Pseudomonadales bacterium]|nr:outer membrane beta-barrel protein [Pseudomonadales bacterium]
MKSKKTTAVFSRKKTFWPPLFGLFVLSRAADAQQSSVIQPLAPPVESISQLNMTNDFEVFGQRPAATPPGQYEPFKWDQFVFRPHADYQFTSAYGILAAPSNRVDTVIQTISPGILVNLGQHWALDYTATIGLYSNTNFGTEFDNSISLTGQTVYGDWLFGFLQTADLSKSPLIETGGQTSTQNYDTAVTGHHEDSEHISEDLGVYQNFQFSQNGFEDTRSWSTLDWLNYAPQSRFNVGIGAGLGYNNAEFGPDSFFQQLLGRLNWRLRDKLSLQLSGGIEETEFLGNEGAGDIFSPIYGGTIQYQLFSQTQISVFINRSVDPSLFVGEYEELTSVGASFSQRLLGQIFLSVSGSYNNQKYVASSLDVSANRTDKFYSLSVRLSHAFLQRGTASVFYQYGSDDSTFSGYSYASNQYGVEVNYSF